MCACVIFPFVDAFNVAITMATLYENHEESDINWDWDDTKLWWYKINSCNACFKRKRGLFYHRREIHMLMDYEANISNQQL